MAPRAVKITECGKYCGPTANGPTISFSSFRQSFTTNVNYLKRRFSSGDLSSECEDGEAPVDPYSKPPAPPPPPPSQSSTGSDLSLNLRSGSKTTSAPSSPAKSRESLLQRVQSLTGQARDQGASILGAAVSSAASRVTTGRSVYTDLQRVQSLTVQARNQGVSSSFLYTKQSDFILTAWSIDSTGSLLQCLQSLTEPMRDQGTSILGAEVSSSTPSVTSGNTDWGKYFRGRRIGDCEIRVEQAEFREITVTATADAATVSMTVLRGGTRVGRSFRPDFLLVRQNMRDAGEDYKRLLLALKFGGVPSINNLNAIFNFQDKPWVFGHLVQLQRRLGKENFPLIEQTFYPDHREMVSNYA
ncbi:unnamed protein product [Phaedon cochleariae]|uniref:Synapsin n=1 Tax=Phaedon cochleariae TaxID=80249 RepID=A0A9N9SJ78_PHACE|nr:unnamed protein product [Phaedon cochleariae]